MFLNRFKSFALLISVLLGLVACGQKGPLRLPDEEIKKGAANTDGLHQTDGQVLEDKTNTTPSAEN